LKPRERLLFGCVRPLPLQAGAIVGVTCLAVLVFCRQLRDVPLWFFGSLALSPASLLLGVVVNALLAFLFPWTHARSLRHTCSVVGAILAALYHLWSLLAAAWVFGMGPKPPFFSSRQLGAMLDFLDGCFLT